MVLEQRRKQDKKEVCRNGTLGPRPFDLGSKVGKLRKDISEEGVNGEWEAHTVEIEGTRRVRRAQKEKTDKGSTAHRNAISIFFTLYVSFVFIAQLSCVPLSLSSLSFVGLALLSLALSPSSILCLSDNDHPC